MAQTRKLEYILFGSIVVSAIIVLLVLLFESHYIYVVEGIRYHRYPSVLIPSAIVSLLLALACLAIPYGLYRDGFNYDKGLRLVNLSFVNLILSFSSLCWAELLNIWYPLPWVTFAVRALALVAATTTVVLIYRKRGRLVLTQLSFHDSKMLDDLDTIHSKLKDLQNRNHHHGH